MGDVRGNKKFYEEIMVALDKDCNGVIDYSEFITAAVNKTLLLSQENLRKAFNMIDLDKSGYITIDELRNAFEMNSKKHDQVWAEIMQEVDKNNDGLISYDEFTEVMKNVMKEHFKDLDNLTHMTEMHA